MHLRIVFALEVVILGHCVWADSGGGGEDSGSGPPPPHIDSDRLVCALISCDL